MCENVIKRCRPYLRTALIIVTNKRTRGGKEKSPEAICHDFFTMVLPDLTIPLSRSMPVTNEPGNTFGGGTQERDIKFETSVDDFHKYHSIVSEHTDGDTYSFRLLDVVKMCLNEWREEILLLLETMHNMKNDERRTMLTPITIDHYTRTVDVLKLFIEALDLLLLQSLETLRDFELVRLINLKVDPHQPSKKPYLVTPTKSQVSWLDWLVDKRVRCESNLQEQ